MTDKEIGYNSLIPELSVSNIDISKKFYLDLGFKIRYERKENKFCFLQLEGNQIMIEENNDNWNTGKLEHPYGRGINLSMTVSNIEKMYEILKEKNIKFFLDLEIHEYRIDDKISYDKEFLIQDPDGYLLRFNN
jgi:predicted lactoylglutathione lyase